MTIKHLTFDNSGTIEFGALTADYQTIVAMSDDADFLFVYNTTDVAVMLSIPNGANATRDIRYPAKSSMAIDCRTNSKRIAKGSIQVKYVTIPTLGEVTVTVAR